MVRSLGGKAALAKVNVDEEPALAEKFGVQSIPTLLVFKGGVIAKVLVGYMPKADIRKALEEAGVK